MPAAVAPAPRSTVFDPEALFEPQPLSRRQTRRELAEVSPTSSLPHRRALRASPNPLFSALRAAPFQTHSNPPQSLLALSKPRNHPSRAQKTVQFEPKKDRKSTRLNSSHGYISY